MILLSGPRSNRGCAVVRTGTLRPIAVLLTLAWLALSGCSDSTGPTTTGSIEVTTVTTGTSLDPDGYVLTVDGGDEQAIGVNETITLSDVEGGGHELELTGVTSNCTVISPNPLIVTVVTGETVPASFEVECESVAMEVAPAWPDARSLVAIQEANDALQDMRQGATVGARPLSEVRASR